MTKFVRVTILGILFSSLASPVFALLIGNQGRYIDIPLPQEALPTTYQQAGLNTDTVFILNADSFADDQGQALNLKGTNFSHGMGVITKQIETFQNMASTIPELSNVSLKIATFDGRILAAYNAAGPVDPSTIPQGSKSIVLLIADIQGDTQDPQTGKISFSADSVYQTLVQALEALKDMNVPVVVNLSLSAEERVMTLEELMKQYSGNTLFCTSAGGEPGNQVDNISNLIAVGSTSDSRTGLSDNVVFAEGRVQVTNPQTGINETAYGKSFAVPQAVMTAALAWQQNGYLNSADIKNAIISPTMQATADAPGVLNPQASVELASSASPSTPPVASPVAGIDIGEIGPFSPYGFIW